MIKVPIKYTDYDGNEREEDYRFNLSKAELIELEYTMPGGLKSYIEKIVQSKDTVEIYKMFAYVIDKAYGVKSLDGKSFKKSPEITKEFKETEAYSELLMKIISDAAFAAKFINEILPKDIDVSNANNAKVLTMK